MHQTSTSSAIFLKYLALPLFLFTFSSALGQNISSKKWKDLFSYTNVLAIAEDDGKLIAATENGIFYYSTTNGEISKLSKANGLHEVKISAFDFNPATKIGVVGYATGALDIITPQGITYVVDIPVAQGYNGNKKINHVSITGDKAVISVNYGVSVYDLVKKEFGSTCFFTTAGVFQASREAAIKGEKLYAATDTGIKSHALNVTFPVYSTWETVTAGNFTQMAADATLAFSTTTTVSYENTSGIATIPATFTEIQDVVVNEDKIIITDKNRVYIYSTAGAVLNNITFSEACNTANIIKSKVYGGTQVSGVKDEAGKLYKPDGPYNNASYKISLLNDQIWVSTGGLESFNGPVYRDLGYYHFDGQQWNYPSYFIDNPILFDVMDVVPNPSKPGEVFFTNHNFAGDKGIYKMENNVFVKRYKNNDVSSPYFNRPIGLSFDENNVLFASVFAIENSPLGTGYYFYNAGSDSFTLIPVSNTGGALKPLLKNGFLYLPSPFLLDGGLVIKNYNNNPGALNTPLKIIRTENELPINGVVSAAVDVEGDAWIGTRQGLRILPDVESAISELAPQTEPIIITQNSVAEELFRDNTIMQIAVDSGNHKWVSVDGGGVYYLSANGEQTIKQFTKENSPLPTNSVTDIKVDEKTGKVYFVTLDGIVVYQGDVSDVTSEFGNVSVYPNPVVQSQFRGNVTIRGLANKANIRITDAAGNLVHSAIARGGFYEWNLNNLKGKRVASGVYFVLMTNDDASSKATIKIAVVN